MSDNFIVKGYRNNSEVTGPINIRRISDLLDIDEQGLTDIQDQTDILLTDHVNKTNYKKKFYKFREDLSVNIKEVILEEVQHILSEASQETKNEINEYVEQNFVSLTDFILAKNENSREHTKLESFINNLRDFININFVTKSYLNEDFYNNLFDKVKKYVKDYVETNNTELTEEIKKYFEIYFEEHLISKETFYLELQKAATEHRNLYNEINLLKLYLNNKFVTKDYLDEILSEYKINLNNELKEYIDNKDNEIKSLINDLQNYIEGKFVNKDIFYLFEQTSERTHTNLKNEIQILKSQLLSYQQKVNNISEKTDKVYNEVLDGHNGIENSRLDIMEEDIEYLKHHQPVPPEPTPTPPTPVNEYTYYFWMVDSEHLRTICNNGQIITTDYNINYEVNACPMIQGRLYNSYEIIINKFGSVNKNSNLYIILPSKYIDIDGHNLYINGNNTIKTNMLSFNIEGLENIYNHNTTYIHGGTTKSTIIEYSCIQLTDEINNGQNINY